MVTKSGGNDWHGSAFEFLRNDVFDAENFFQNYFNAPGAARSKKESLRQNNFGGVLTGPIWIPKSTTATTRPSSCSTMKAAPPAGRTCADGQPPAARVQARRFQPAADTADADQDRRSADRD
jgi:hypothetical protein